MELGAEKEGVVFQLHDFDEVPLGINAGDHEPALLEAREVFVCDFVAVAMTFHDRRNAIGRTGLCLQFQAAGIRTEPH